jgi:hypothetical protein
MADIDFPTANEIIKELHSVAPPSTREIKGAFQYLKDLGVELHEQPDASPWGPMLEKKYIPISVRGKAWGVYYKGELYAGPGDPLIPYTIEEKCDECKNERTACRNKDADTGDDGENTRYVSRIPKRN